MVKEIGEMKGIEKNVSAEKKLWCTLWYWTTNYSKYKRK